jgi:transcriptional regulator with XRE-family HTH domain
MDSPAPTIETKLASRLRNLRAQRSLTLDGLADRSGVSRSMISLIERCESSPTANVLDKLAAALGVSTASLFAEEKTPGADPLSKRADQSVWRDPASGYIRRNLSPPEFPSQIELVEIILPPHAHVVYDTPSRATVLDQQVFVLEGAVRIGVGEASYDLGPGDCLAMVVGRHTSFRNSSPAPVRYIVALTVARNRSGSHDA